MTSKTYLSLCKEGAEIITDNTQISIFGGFAPNSKTAETLSNAMGSKTVMSGSVTRGKNDPSKSLQMMERPLMTADELKSIPKGNFVVMKTGSHPMKTKLKLFLDWGITFDKSYEKEMRKDRKIAYADRKALEANIIKEFGLFIKDTATGNSKTAKTKTMETQQNNQGYNP